jgi:hypothetical protein
MAKRLYIDEVRQRLVGVQPDMTRLLTYAEIADLYGERLRRVGIGATSESIQATMRSLTARRIIRRYEVAGRIRIPANEVEIYLDVLEEPRPVA